MLCNMQEIKCWGRSSNGRALDLHSRGNGIDTHRFHNYITWRYSVVVITSDSESDNPSSNLGTAFKFTIPGVWSRGMIRASGARGPEFDSRSSPNRLRSSVDRAIVS